MDFVSEATLTFDDGEPAGAGTWVRPIWWSGPMTVLAGRFAQVCGVEQALARAAAREATHA